MAAITPEDVLDNGKRHLLDYWVAEHVLGWRWFKGRVLILCAAS